MADVWDYDLTKGIPTWHTEQRMYTIPVEVSVTLDIDSGGANEWAATTVTRTVEKNKDVSNLASEMADDVQDFINKCKNERNAHKSSQFDSLITGIDALVSV